MTLLILLCSMAVGYLWSGRTISSLHRYVHTVKVAGLEHSHPQTAAVYALYHLAHHRDTPRQIRFSRFNLPLRKYWQLFRWSIPFMLFDDRWIAIRTLIGYRSTQALIVLLASMALGVPLLGVLLGVAGFLFGAYACLLAYETCHSWTHSGGPAPSELHVQHHQRPSGNFGMWRWNNRLSMAHMQWTIASLRHAEAILFRVPTLRRRLNNILAHAVRGTNI